MRLPKQKFGDSRVPRVVEHIVRVGNAQLSERQSGGLKLGNPRKDLSDIFFIHKRYMNSWPRVNYRLSSGDLNDRDHPSVYYTTKRRKNQDISEIFVRTNNCSPREVNIIVKITRNKSLYKMTKVWIVSKENIHERYCKILSDSIAKSAEIC